MRWSTLRLLLVALSVAALMGTGVTQAQNEPTQQITTVQSTTVTPAPANRHNCRTIYTRARHDSTARRYYSRNRHLTRREAHWLWKLRDCQATNKAQAASLRQEHRLKLARDRRMSMYCGTPACNRRLGMWMADRRFGPGAGACIDYIVMHESHWNERQPNLGGSGAYGIPQALPGAKMASAGADWATNPATQIRWMLGYVLRYGGPCGAAAYWRSHQSY